MRECETGEILEDEECKICDEEGTRYTFEASGNDCEDCPSEAVCLGGATVYPKEGYWRSAWNSSVFYECPVDIACLGGEQYDISEGKCDGDLGYSGRKCTVCIDDYTRVGKFECSKCPNEAENVLILMAILFGV